MEKNQASSKLPHYIDIRDKKEMQVLLNITEKFGAKNEIKFNTTKTNFLSVNGHINNVNS